MKTRDTGSLEVSYGGCKALVKQRGDGRWVVRWREARRGKTTTLMTKEGAMAKARDIVRRLASGQGGRMVAVDEAELVTRLRRLCGDRHPASLLSLLEDFAARRGGVAALERAVRHYEASGIADVQRVPFKTARDRFVDLYDDSPWQTRAGMRKEFDAFIKVHPGLDVLDIEVKLLEPWIMRRKANGEKLEPRSINNRLAVWVTLLNRCKEWGYLPRGERHAGEQMNKLTEPDKAVPIWSPKVAFAIYDLLWEEMPRKLPYFIIACWLGLRPSEVGRVRWELFDWVRNYLHVDITVGLKLQQERFVPLNATARAMLEKWLVAQGLWKKATEGTLTGRIGVKRDHEAISALVRERGLVKVWPHDVTRHSWISYMIAMGQSKHQIAEWAGNSEGVINKRYRRPLRREDGEEWFPAMLDASRALA